MNFFPQSEPDEISKCLMESLPIIPIPRSGSSEALKELQGRTSVHALLIGADGAHLYTKRPWIEARSKITGRLPITNFYGDCGNTLISMLCGPIPGSLLKIVLAHLEASLPNEAAAFILWNSETGEFRIYYPHVLEASPATIRYVRPSTTSENEHIVADIHSHGRAKAFWSNTDDTDDAHETSISVVIGELGLGWKKPAMIARFCSRGIYTRLDQSPFEDIPDLDFKTPNNE